MSKNKVSGGGASEVAKRLAAKNARGISLVSGGAIAGAAFPVLSIGLGAAAGALTELGIRVKQWKANRSDGFSND